MWFAAAPVWVACIYMHLYKYCAVCIYTCPSLYGGVVDQPSAVGELERRQVGTKGGKRLDTCARAACTYHYTAYLSIHGHLTDGLYLWCRIRSTYYRYMASLPMVSNPLEEERSTEARCSLFWLASEKICWLEMAAPLVMKVRTLPQWRIAASTTPSLHPGGTTHVDPSGSIPASCSNRRSTHLRNACDRHSMVFCEASLSK